MKSRAEKHTRARPTNLQVLGTVRNSAMDLPYLLNSSKIGPEYVRQNLDSGVPYLIFMSLIMLTGTVGNILVIGAVIRTKVSRCKGMGVQIPKLKITT